jgi:hypothetical protein
LFYDLGMEHFELHILNTPADLASATSAGLISLEIDYDFFCANCEEIVGVYEGMFYPFGIVVAEDDEEWFICEECFIPTAYPQTFDEHN